MRRIAIFTLVAGMLAATLAPPCRGAAQGRSTSADAATVRLPIRSKAQLDAYLRDHAGQPTPLDALDPGARERFVDGLVFGSNGLGGFHTQDLPPLTREQGHRLLALFGTERYADALQRWATQPRAPAGDAPIGALQQRYNRFNEARHLRQPGSDVSIATPSHAWTTPRWHCCIAQSTPPTRRPPRPRAWMPSFGY
jgi:hypothetical protein